MSALENVINDVLEHKKDDEKQQQQPPKLASSSSASRPSTRGSTASASKRDVVPNRRPSQQAGRMPSQSLDASYESPVEDPEAPNFVHNDSAFRGPFQAAGGTSPRTPRSRQHSAALGSVNENEGFFRRWVEEPLGLATAPSSPSRERTAAPSPRRQSETARRQSETGTPRQMSQDSPARSPKPVTWDSSVMNRIGLRRQSEPHPSSHRGDQDPAKPDGEAASAGPNDDSTTPTNPEFRPAANRLASRRWAMIKHRLAPHQGSGPAGAPAAAVSPDINISDELLGGGLATLMLKMHFDRDEQDKRRVPVLLHHLKIRVSDSINPLKGTHTAFRIECEYANGAARWVIYRQLRDFVTLHTHYRVAKVYGRSDFDLPEFPLTSLPYFKFLKSQEPNASHEERKAAFARLQRLHLENYLLALIKAVMFRPEANRLAKFFEISALSISLAKSGGFQGKAGVLRVLGNQISRRSVKSGLSFVGIGQATKPRWWIVRESYMVAVDDPGDTEVWDVFIFDQDFALEQPKRYYRKLDPFKLRDDGESGSSDSEADSEIEHIPDPNNPEEPPQHHKGSTLHRLSKILHVGKHHHHSHHTGSEHTRSHHSHHEKANGHIPNGDAHDGGVDPGPGEGAETEGAPKKEKQASTTLDEQANDAIKATKDTQVMEAGGKSKKRFNKDKSVDVSQHTFHIQNSQRRLKLVAKNERQLNQWIMSIDRMASRSHWTSPNRFESFAPIRLNVAAQWLVDGRDYFWNLSRALSLAKHTIYIHDWWLSPELQMRRPGKNQYRVDKLLKRKAEEGVKIYVIIYREVSNRTTPTDSNYTKQRLVSLHPNIMVQRSPGHYTTGTFFWAHHEKLCVIDDSIAFMGGLDMCFGRWDTPQHALVDDPEDGSDQIWLGKDYANERVLEFHTLSKPFEDMYDRTKVPRMPWHDVAMQILGQPARDLSRHFVQRWNYLLRIKTHSRIMPFLLPPAEFNGADLDAQHLSGTCEVQICRSAGNWSLGFQHRPEHSIQNAYLKAIQMSEHFVYIENQFFITSTVVNDVKIENQIGDALVSRIIRAHHEGTPWRACIVIPLLPGFTFPIDHSDASAVRIILECQNRTISRGPHSIYARLRKEGIDPNDHISFFGLRQWGKLRGGTLTTEQLYIHGKTMIVDDRLAIIGSANINERSQRGDRDSELASIIRDTDMIDSTMAGKPFKVGRFAHTLRIRLMREHLGVDVDKMYTEDLLSKSPVHNEADVAKWDPDNEEGAGYKEDNWKNPKKVSTGFFGHAREEAKGPVEQLIHGADDDFTGDVAKASHKLHLTNSNMNSRANDQTLESEREMTNRDGKKVPGFPSSVVPTIEEQIINERRPAKAADGEKPIKSELANGDAKEGSDSPPEASVDGGKRELFGAPSNAQTSRQTDDEPPHPKNVPADADDEEKDAPSARKLLRQHLSVKVGAKPWAVPTPRPDIDPEQFDDPVSDKFYKDVWLSAASHNTEIFRKVFHCTPDDLVTTWKQYKEFVQHQERLAKPPREDGHPTRREPAGRMPSSGVTNAAEEGKDATGGPEGTDVDPDPEHQNEARAEGTHDGRPDMERTPSDTSATVNGNPEPGPLANPAPHLPGMGGSSLNVDRSSRDRSGSTSEEAPQSAGGAQSTRSRSGTLGADLDRGPSTAGSNARNGGDKEKNRKPSHPSEPLEQWELDEMEDLLRQLCGHLVIYPTRFLEAEDASNNFLFNTDRLLPLPIYD